MIVLISLISSIFNQEHYECTTEDKIPGPCTYDYIPVCGWPIILCLRFDCTTTYPNRCTACKDPLIRFVTDGECIKPQSSMRGLEFLGNDN